MNYSFIKKHKALSAFFVFGVLAIVGGLTIYKSNAAPTYDTWTQTTWSDGQSPAVIDLQSTTPSTYSLISGYVDYNTDGEISIANLFTNPSFDNDINNWSTAGPGGDPAEFTMEHETATTYSPAGTAKITASSDNNNFIYQELTAYGDIAEPRHYNLFAYFYSEDFVPNNTNLKLYFNEGFLDATIYDLDDSDWYLLKTNTPITLTSEEPLDYGISFNGINGQTFYVDDISLYPTDSANNILISNIFDLGSPQLWGRINYNQTTPGAIVKVRSGYKDALDNIVFDNEFNTCTSIADNAFLDENDCVSDLDQYLQYYIELNYDENLLTGIPVLPHFYDLSFESRSPVISGSLSSPSNAENTETITLTIDFLDLIPDPLYEATVEYTITGTATNGSDYTFMDLSGNLGITSGSPATLNFDIQQDNLYEADETIIITLSNPINAEIYGSTEFTYTITNDDLPPTIAWKFSDPGIDIYEENEDHITVVAELDAISGLDVNVPLIFNGSATKDTDYIANLESITIPAGSLGAAVDLTIDIINDNLYENTETIEISLGEPENATLGATDTYTIPILDDHDYPLISFDSPVSNYLENSGTVSTTITLSNPSNEEVSFDFQAFDGTATSDDDYLSPYVMSPIAVTFPINETSLEIETTIIDDSLAEGDETIDFTITNPINGNLSPGMDVHTLTINDNDVPGISATLDTIEDYTTEWGGYQRFEVVLNTQPDGDVVINVESSDITEGTVDEPSLTFNASTWDIPQYITVTGEDDDIADGDMPYTISLIIDPLNTTDLTGYAVLPPTLIASTNMNEDVAGVTVTPTELTTYEYGSSADFTIVLTSEPEGVVVIDLLNTNPAEGTLSTNRINFNNLNWGTPQTITVDSVNDADPDDDQTYSIEITVNSDHSTDPQYILINPEDVTVTNMDDDTPGITVSGISGHTTEDGGEATFTVVLDSQPSADVIISLESDNTAEGTVSPAELTFTDADWNRPQTVTVTGVNDDIDDGDIAYNIRGTVSSDDLNYHDFPFDIVPVTNEDNDTAGFDVSLISGDTNESGGTALFTIVLTSEPTANVIFDISSSDTGEGTVSPENIIFTSANWGDAQTITVTGVDDYIVDGPQDYQIDVGPSISLDLNYHGLFSADVGVTNVDNDSVGFTVTQSAGSTNVTEGGATDNYTIRLNTIPNENVVVTITPNAQITVSPTTLTFTAANWNINQTVTVTAVNDTVVEGNHTGTISHSVSSDDRDYGPLEISNILVAITDNDSSPSTGGGGGGGFWFPSHNPDETQPTPSQTQTDPQREQRLEKLQSMGVSIHGLVKIPDDGNPNTTFDNIVYYIGTDGMRHVFPNATIYKTWYDSFRYVQVYPVETLSQIPLGDNVRYRPGVKMIKFTSSNRVYAIEAGGKLRWILNEKVAWYMYGKGWQKHIVSLPDSLFPGYEFGDDISHSDQFDFAAEAAQSQNISMDLGL